jgi:hypothetical protein
VPSAETPHVWGFWLQDERSRKAVEVAERFVDGEASRKELNLVRAAAWAPVRGCIDVTGYRLARTAWAAARDGASAASAAVRAFCRPETAFLCGLLREIVGNPFRPSADISPAVLTWNEGTVWRIAAGIHAEQAFGRLPILADALEEAGCTDTHLLGHCRSQGPPPVVPGDGAREPADVRSHSRSEVPHVRGCWAVDLIVGNKVGGTSPCWPS